MTALNAAIAASLANIGTINENIARLRDEASAARKAAIEPFLEALAASGEVSLIAIWGYTPGFNDGEPCEHSADFVVNIEQAQNNDAFDMGIGLDDDFEWAGELRRVSSWDSSARDYKDNPGAFEHNVKLCAENGHVYKKPSDEILKAISNVIFDTVEEEEGTDYYVAYILKGGKFERVEGEYYCGH